MLSIVTVVKNDLMGFERTRRSVESQTSPQWEHVVVTASRHESTYLYVEGLEDLNTKLVAQKGVGIYAAMNEGLAVARSKYVLFLNAGDTFVNEDSIGLMLESVHRRSPPWAVFGGYVRTGKSVIKRSPHPSPRPSDFAFGRARVLHPSICYRRDILMQLKGYNECFAIAGDLELNIRMSKLTRPTVVDIPVSVFYADGISSNHPYRAIFESNTARNLSFSQNPMYKAISSAWLSYQIVRTFMARTIKSIRR